MRTLPRAAIGYIAIISVGLMAALLARALWLGDGDMHPDFGDIAASVPHGADRIFAVRGAHCARTGAQFLDRNREDAAQ